MMRATVRAGRGTVRLLGGVLVVLLAACGSGVRDTPAAPETAAPSGSSPAPECEELGYPCTWAAVTAEAAERTDQVARIAAALLTTVEDPRAVADVLARTVDLAEIQTGDTAVRFRLPGARAVWVSASHDHNDLQPQASREAPGSGETAWTALSRWSGGLFPTLHAQTPSAGADQIAGRTPGDPKKALILAPFYYELGHEVSAVRELFARARDYRVGSIVLHANLHSSRPNDPVHLRREEVRPVSGQVTIDDFLGWDKYNFVYLATHGVAVCPGGVEGRAREPLIAKGACYTSLSVRDLPGGAAGLREARNWQARIANLPGVEVEYRSVGSAHPGLSPAEAAACLGTTDPTVLAPGTTKPCLFVEQIPSYVSVTTTFFRQTYPGGFNDIVIFLAVCEALKANDLEDALAPTGNRDVAVFGFEEVVDSHVARVLGTMAVELFVKGGALNSVVLAKLETRASELNVAFFQGVLRSRHRARQLETGLGSIVESSSNPTHARDVVLLIDRATGAELQDGATVIVRSAGDGGTPDRLDVYPQIMGVDPDEVPTDLRLQVQVVGEPMPAETYLPDRRVGEGEYRHPHPVSLGRAHRRGEVVDLEVRAALPGGGESRWRYKKVRLTSCYWTADLSGVLNERVSGSRILIQPPPSVGQGDVQGIGLFDRSRAGGIRTIALKVTTGRAALSDQGAVGGIPIGTTRKNGATIRVTTVVPDERIVGEFAFTLAGILDRATTRAIHSPVHVKGEFVWTPACRSATVSVEQFHQDYLLTLLGLS